jgi:ferredoxin
VLLAIASNAGSVLMRSHDGGIDHLHRCIMHCSQCIHDLVPDAGPSPANEAIVTGRIGAKRLW